MSRILTLVRSSSRRRKPRGGDEGGVARLLDEAIGDRRFQSLPPRLEQSFQDDTSEDQCRALFRAALVAALVYNLQLIAEWSLTCDMFPLAAALHFGVVTPCLLAIAAYARSADTPLRRDLMGVAIPVLIALQVAVVYACTASPGAPYYLTLFAVIAILCNASLPLSSRASLWTTALCLALLLGAARAPHAQVDRIHFGALFPIALCMVMTLHSAAQRNRETRRVYLLDQRQRLRVAEVGLEARHDALTGLANRRRLEEAAAQLWANDPALSAPISVVLYDVDRFKAFNDLNGHQAGDDCLRRIAACAAVEIGAEDDVAARYGGEEFILLLPRTPLEDARRIAERLRVAVAALRIDHPGGDLGVVTASFGVASGDSAHVSFEELTADADAALYQAKRGGRNRVLVAGPPPETRAA